MNKLAIILVLVFSAMFLLFAQDHKEVVYTTLSGAIDGYDPVAYFSMGKAMKGKDQYTHEWNGGVWHFVSKENRSLFMNNPEQYAPQYGGYCAFGMSKGYKAKIDPTAWSIEDNKLYLNYNDKVKENWFADRMAFIKKADENWKKLKNEK